MNNNLTVAMFLPDLGFGGAEKGLVKIANELTRLGYQVDMIIFGERTDFASLLSNKVQVINFHKKGIIQVLILLVRYLVHKKPDHLLACLDLTNLIAILAKKISRQKTRVSIYIVNSTSLHRRTKIKKYLERIILSAIYPFADHILANSHGAQEDLARYINIPLQKVQMQYLPTADTQLGQLASERISHPWFQKGAIPVIIGVGRLVEQKNFGLLIDSFAIVVKQTPANLMIIGEGGQHDYLQNKIAELGIKEQVEIHAPTLNPYPYVKQAAVLAVPSKWDGLSMILVEALYLGVPVICTDCVSGPREILDQGRYGTLVPNEDKQALADGIMDILNGKTPEVDPAWLNQFAVEYGTSQLIDKLGIGKPSTPPDN